MRIIATNARQLLRNNPSTTSDPSYESLTAALMMPLKDRSCMNRNMIKRRRHGFDADVATQHWGRSNTLGRDTPNQISTANHRSNHNIRLSDDTHNKHARFNITGRRNSKRPPISFGWLKWTRGSCQHYKSLHGPGGDASTLVTLAATTSSITKTASTFDGTTTLQIF